MHKFIADFVHRQRQRAAYRHLETFDDHRLADIGLTRADLRALRYGTAPRATP